MEFDVRADLHNTNTENKEQNQIEQPQQTYSLETEDLKKTIESTLNLDSVSLKMTGKAITQQSQIISDEETIIEMSNKGTLYKMSIPHEQQGISQTVSDDPSSDSGTDDEPGTP